MGTAETMSDEKYRVLAIHAHPDDESSKGAATMARYADEGHRVRVVTCTGGERGDILNPAMDRPGVRENMNQVRREEMARAADILGVEHVWLGYEDSGLPEGDPLPPLPEGSFARADKDEVAQKIVAEIREFKPNVIITYDENGGYPHPDHIMVHEVSMLAWEASAQPDYHPELGDAWASAKLYYTHGFVRRRFETFAETLAASRAQFLAAQAETEKQENPGEEFDQERYDTVMSHIERWRKLPDIYPRVTTRVNVGEWFQRRDDALRAHATQVDPEGPFFTVDLDMQMQVWPTEEFELAKSRVETTLPESDLFQGLGPADEQPSATEVDLVRPDAATSEPVSEDNQEK